MSTCYSDHNEDVRTKGSCDYCGGTEPDGPRVGVVMSSELGDNWSAEHHLAKRDAAAELQEELGSTVAWLASKLPGDRPDEVGPSSLYGWRVVDPMTWETQGQVVQVVEATNGRQWIATPARYYAEDIARWGERSMDGLAIDYGMGWYLPREDFQPLITFARRVLAEN